MTDIVNNIICSKIYRIILRSYEANSEDVNIIT